MNRRRFIGSASAGFTVWASGCLTGSDSEEGNSTNDSSTRPEAWKVKQFVTASTADWWTEGTAEPGHIALYGSEKAAFDGLDVSQVDDDRRSEIEAFIENTAYQPVAETDPSAILYIQSVGPHTGYSEIRLEELGEETETITGTARARETDEMGGDAITFPSALVRVEGSPSGLTDATIAVIDGWGNEATLETDLIE